MVPAQLRVVVVLVILAATTWMAAEPASAQAQPGGVRFSNLNVEIEESAESLRVSVERTGALHVSRLVVDYASESGSARGGIDYADTAGTLTFEVGESIKSFSVRVRNDTEAEEREQFTIRLSNARGEAPTVGGPMTVAIWDDDTPPFDPEAADVAASTSESTAARRAVAPRPVVAPAPVIPAPPTVSGASAAATPRPAPRPAPRARRATPSTRRQVSYRQSPVTPFELRPAATGATTSQGFPTRVDPILALLAGLLLARVGAEVWFRSRVEPT